MSKFKIDRRDDWGDVNSKAARLESMQHLWHASKDINDWVFSMLPPPPGSPRTLHHIFEGRCKKTGVTSPIPVDEADLVKFNGNADLENASLITQFAEALAWLDDALAQMRQQQLSEELRGKGFYLPGGGEFDSVAYAAQAALLKGDHPSIYG